MLDLNLLVLWSLCLNWRVLRGISTCCRHLKKWILTGDKRVAGLLTVHKSYLLLLLHIWNSPCSLLLKPSWSSNDAAAFWKGSWILCWKLCRWRGWERCWRSRATLPRSSAPLGYDSPHSGPAGCEGQRRESSRTRRHLWEQTREKKRLIVKCSIFLFARFFVNRDCQWVQWSVFWQRTKLPGKSSLQRPADHQTRSAVQLSYLKIAPEFWATRKKEIPQTKLPDWINRRNNWIWD